jgi:hypothetical protein
VKKRSREIRYDAGMIAGDVKTRQRTMFLNYHETAVRAESGGDYSGEEDGVKFMPNLANQKLWAN